MTTADKIADLYRRLRQKSVCCVTQTITALQEFDNEEDAFAALGYSQLFKFSATNTVGISVVDNAVVLGLTRSS